MPNIFCRSGVWERLSVYLEAAVKKLAGAVDIWKILCGSRTIGKMSHSFGCQVNASVSSQHGNWLLSDPREKKAEATKPLMTKTWKSHTVSSAKSFWLHRSALLFVLRNDMMLWISAGNDRWGPTWRVATTYSTFRKLLCQAIHL